jgi:hypothetical protein
VNKLIPTLTLCGALIPGAIGAAQESQKQPTDRQPTLLKVMIVLSRYQGEKKISSLPYTLSVAANSGKTSLRMGAQVPISSAAMVQAKEGAPITSYSYRDVGTNIDCSASTLDGGQFRIDLSIEDSSVYGEEQQGTPKRAGDLPAFRSFRSTNTLTLRDGQTLQFTTATDKITGEVVKADVTLTVVK